MPVFSPQGNLSRHYVHTKDGSTVLTTNTTIISQAITIPEGTWAMHIVASGWLTNSAGGTGAADIEIVDSTLGVLNDHTANQAASLQQDFTIQAAVDGLSEGARTITLRGTDDGGAGAPTVTKAELSITLIPAENFTLTTS